MLLFVRATRTDTEFTRDDDMLAVDTTAGDVAIAIPSFTQGPQKPVNPIIKNWRGGSNVIVSASDENVLIEGRRDVTLAPGQSIALAVIFPEAGGDPPMYLIEWQSGPP